MTVIDSLASAEIPRTASHANVPLDSSIDHPIPSADPVLYSFCTVFLLYCTVFMTHAFLVLGRVCVKLVNECATRQHTCHANAECK